MYGGGVGAAPIALDRRVEVPEALAGDGGRDLRADAERDHGLVGDEEAARLLDRVEDRRHVEGRDRAEIDHLDRDAVAGDGLGRRDRFVHHPRHRDDGEVGARAHDRRPADGDDVVGRGLRSLHAVEQPVLDEHDRVRVLDGGAEQPVGVGRRRRHHHRQPGDVREQRLEALRVLAARRTAGAELGPHRQRHLRGAAGHERQLGRLVQQLVEAHTEEVEVHQLDDGMHAGHRRADSEAHDRALGDRSVADAFAELVVQAAR